MVEVGNRREGRLPAPPEGAGWSVIDMRDPQGRGLLSVHLRGRATEVLKQIVDEAKREIPRISAILSRLPVVASKALNSGWRRFDKGTERIGDVDSFYLWFGFVWPRGTHGEHRKRHLGVSSEAVMDRRKAASIVA